MFDWLFGSSRSDRARNIFRFWDGRENRRVDPLKVWTSLATHPTFELEVHPKRVDLPGRDGAEALQVCVRAVRDVFRIDEMEDGGLTDEECFALLDRFGNWLTALKKNGNPRPTLPPRTGHKPCPNCPPQATPTSDSSASGSTTPAA